METHFLAICSPLRFDADRTMAISTATLSTWHFYQQHTSVSLLLEALNQFAVRYVTSCFPCGVAQRFLPVMVESFICKVALCCNQMNIQGELELVYNAFRVNCRVYSVESQEKVIAQASIIINEVELPDLFSDVLAEGSISSLWQTWQITTQVNGFRLNSRHSLFQEHFPGRPVCPGSLLIDLVLSMVGNTKSAEIIELHKIKFLKPVTPNRDYVVSVIAGDHVLSGVFFINADNGERHVNGNFSFSQVSL
ncbi:hypothetical protein ABR965_22490 [Photorhabdus laumondii]|uniref:hypothetical protein n=1 Tax=Photorhabdus laumondii TaxID=2218628 RepID=UPI003314D9E3